MMLSFPTRIFVGSFVLLLTTGTIFASETTAVRKQQIYSNVTYPVKAPICNDNPIMFEKCLKAGKPCHCEENRYEMYTYCKRSCGFCSRDRQPQRFWRIVNWSPLNRTWYINEINFFLGKHDKVPLATDDPTKAIASSTYLAFPASNAFDGNRDSAWLPDGWWERQAGGDWIGYDFAQPVDINSVRVVSDLNDTSDVAASMLVEAGPTAFGPFETRWMIMNRERIADKVFHNPRCQLFWKRFMTDNDAFCYKLITEYLTWSEARDKCAMYGGDLVSINSHEEQIFVQQELLACGFTWLGFNDIKKEQHFKWSDGSNSSFFYWASDEEKDERMNEIEDCAAMARDGQWRQFHCEDRFYAFCKKRILTDSDKVVEPNSVNAPTQDVNKTQLSILPPNVALPPGITAPPQPQPGVPAPIAPKLAPETPAPGVPPPAAEAVPPPNVTDVPPPATAGVSPPATEAVPPPATAGIPPPAAAGVPPPAATDVPPPAAEAVPPPNVTDVPPPATAGVSPPATEAVPPPATAGIPPPAAMDVPPPAATDVPPPFAAGIPPPAAAGVPPPAPEAVPPPATATVPVPAPPAQVEDAVPESEQKHDEQHEDEVKVNKHKKKAKHHSLQVDKVKGKKKKAKQHHKKKKKQLKSSIEKKEESFKFDEKLGPVDDGQMMDEFLDMVTRSDIPNTHLSEKDLRSSIRKKNMKNAERQLRQEKEKTDYSQSANTRR